MAFVDPALRRVLSAISLAVLALCALAASPQQARAETSYPDKAVRIVLPFAAGGVADITARIVAEKLGDKLGQRFYVENQAGAGGIAAARTVISSAPDGYTLALLSNGTAVSVSLIKKLPFDPLRDIEPISSLGFFDFVFATGPARNSRPLRTLLLPRRQNPARSMSGPSISAAPRTCRPNSSRPRPPSISPSSPIGRHPRSRSRCFRAILRS